MLDTEILMPSIQDELKKALGQWNPTTPAPEQPKSSGRPFRVSSNVSRVTYDYVKANPGVTATEAANALLPKGQKPASVSSIMAQMATIGTMRKEGFKYYVVSPEFVPVSQPALRAARVAKTGGTEEVKPVVPTTIEQTNDEPVVAKPTIIKQKVLDMPLREAYALYVELKQFFGHTIKE
jgi:hypothetical protein